MIVHTSRIPRPGETILGGRFFTAAGGKGANQAVAAARAGGEVILLACVGDDTFGAQAVKGCRNEGIDVSRITTVTGEASGIALICVDDRGENSIAVAPGANAHVSPALVERMDEVFAGASVVVLQLEIPLETVIAAARAAAQHGARVVLNPAPAQPLPEELFRHVSIITPNEHEAEQLTGIQVHADGGLDEAADALLAKGIAAVVITLGSHGAYIADAGSRTLIPALKVEAKDTTGAGDVFNGALAVRLSEGETLPEAVRFANVAAAISVTRMGAQPSIPRRDAVDEVLSRMDDSEVFWRFD